MSHARLSKRTRYGFTLIELIVTVVILGILAALAVPAFQAVQDRSRDAVDETSVEALGREAAALAAFDGTAVTAADLELAIGDLGSAADADPATTAAVYDRDTDGTLVPGEWDFLGYAGATAYAAFVPARLPGGTDRVLYLQVAAAAADAKWGTVAEDGDATSVTAADAGAVFGDTVTADDGGTAPSGETSTGTTEPVAGEPAPEPVTTVAYATHTGTSTGVVLPWAVAATDDGGAVITGKFQGTAAFGSFSLTSAGLDDGFTTKIDAAGNVVWATHTGAGAKAIEPKAVTATSDGGAIVTGFFQGTATFGDFTMTSAGSNDAVAFKVDTAGAVVWATHVGTGTQEVRGQGVTATADGGAVVTGDFTGTATYGSKTVTATANYEGFVAKLDAAGAVQWTTHAGAGTGHFVPVSVAAASDGGATVVGHFTNTASFGATNLSSAGSNDAAAFKVDAAGNILWATRTGTGTGNVSSGAVSATSDGGVLVAASFTGTATFGATTMTSAGNNDMATLKVSSAGAVLWASHTGTGGRAVAATSLSTTSDDGAIVAGIFSGTASFGTTSFTSADPYTHDSVAFKVASSGEVLWAAHTGTGIQAVRAQSVSATPDDGAVISGFFQGTASFGTASFTSAGSWDGVTLSVGADGQLG